MNGALGEIRTHGVEFRLTRAVQSASMQPGHVIYFLKQFLI